MEALALSIPRARAIAAWRHWPLVLSRVLVVLAGAIGPAAVGLRPAWQGFDPSQTSLRLGQVGNLLGASAVRWDAIHYLRIAAEGYRHPTDTAFFPLYPLAIHIVAWALGSDAVAGVAISLVAFAIALRLLAALTELELGAAAAQRTVIVLCLTPLSFFFSAVYTESLFLALSLGAFYAARRERWLLAGTLAALASVTRITGVVLLLPLAVLWWQSHPHSRRGVLALGLVPAALLGYLSYMHSLGYGWTGPLHQQFSADHGHHASGPIMSMVAAIQAAGLGAGLLTSGIETIYMPSIRGALSLGAESILLLTVLAAAVYGLWLVHRRLPRAYLAYAATALTVCIWSPAAGQPLTALDRYVLTIFPLWMVLGDALARRPRAATIATMLGAVLLVVYAFQFATWAYVA